MGCSGLHAAVSIDGGAIMTGSKIMARPEV